MKRVEVKEEIYRESWIAENIVKTLQTNGIITLFYIS